MILFVDPDEEIFVFVVPDPCQNEIGMYSGVEDVLVYVPVIILFTPVMCEFLPYFDIFDAPVYCISAYFTFMDRISLWFTNVYPISVYLTKFHRDLVYLVNVYRISVYFINV